MVVLKIGDVVVLKSNSSVKMTVESTDGLHSNCVWFDETNGLQRNRFPNMGLVSINESQSGLGENILLG